MAAMPSSKSLRSLSCPSKKMSPRTVAQDFVLLLWTSIQDLQHTGGVNVLQIVSSPW